VLIIRRVVRILSWYCKFSEQLVALLLHKTWSSTPNDDLHLSKLPFQTYCSGMVSCLKGRNRKRGFDDLYMKRGTG
jgi:hypothetical protein